MVSECGQKVTQLLKVETRLANRVSEDECVSRLRSQAVHRSLHIEGCDKSRDRKEILEPSSDLEESYFDDTLHNRPVLLFAIWCSTSFLFYRRISFPVLSPSLQQCFRVRLSSVEEKKIRNELHDHAIHGDVGVDRGELRRTTGLRAGTSCSQCVNAEASCIVARFWSNQSWVCTGNRRGFGVC